MNLDTIRKALEFDEDEIIDYNFFTRSHNPNNNACAIREDQYLYSHEFVDGARYQHAQTKAITDKLLKIIEIQSRDFKLAIIRMEILVGRLRACHEDTGNHELIGESEAFASEGKEAIAQVEQILKEG